MFKCYYCLQSLWLEDGVNFDALMMARCSVCSAQGQLCPPHALSRGPSVSHVIKKRACFSFNLDFVILTLTATV